jgi:hypothetical protein
VEYSGFSHFSLFSNKYIFLVIQAMRQLVSYIGILEKVALIVYFFIDLTLGLGVIGYFVVLL